jgi:hypothetical protein
MVVQSWLLQLSNGNSILCLSLSLLHSLVSWLPQPVAPDLKLPPSDLIFSCLFPLLDASTILSEASACFRLTTFVSSSPTHIPDEAEAKATEDAGA